MNRRLQLRFKQRLRLLMAGDVLAVLLAVFVSLVLRALSSQLEIDSDYFAGQAFWFLFFAVVWLVLANANDLYRLSMNWSPTRILLRLIRVTLQILLFYMVVFFLAERNELPRLFMLYFAVTSILLIVAWRLIWPRFSDWASEARRILVIGEGAGVQLIREAIEQQAPDAFVIVDVLDTRDLESVQGSAGLTEMAREKRVSDIIVTATRSLQGEGLREVMDATVAGINVLPMPLLYEGITGRFPVGVAGENWTILLPPDTEDISLWMPIKTVLDHLSALIGAVFLLLLLPLVALAIRLDSRGSIFYLQERVGLNGRLFRMIKFRTMVANAEEDSGAVFALGDDPRVTRAGKFLRRSHLDELPQVLNILRGEMSLVGPRPERPEHVASLDREIPFYRVRQTMLPGLTGWAQVHQDYAMDVAETWIKLQYDLYYVRHHSFLLDLEILLRTLGRVLDSRAYRRGTTLKSDKGVQGAVNTR
ncbi:MAG: sugar transferase [Anaerolineaceae bacterium]|nr:sugar transferase [Anaerolineaceae bacterium]